MSDLTEFRDHARAMASGGHDPICSVQPLARYRNVVRPAPGCRGCMPDVDRALWALLAAEVDEHLSRDQPDEVLPVIDDDQLDLEVPC